MLDENIVDAVRCLLAAGRPQREIARDLGVSRASITEISTGRRLSAAEKARKLCPRCRRRAPLSKGARVCVECAARVAAGGAVDLAVDDPAADPLGPDLRPADRRRYEEVECAARVAAGGAVDLAGDDPPADRRGYEETRRRRTARLLEDGIPADCFVLVSSLPACA